MDAEVIRALHERAHHSLLSPDINTAQEFTMFDQSDIIHSYNHVARRGLTDSRLPVFLNPTVIAPAITV